MDKQISQDEALLARLVPGYQGLAQSWECDINNHLNISHFFGRSSDHAFFMRHAMAMSPRQLAADQRGTVALQEHVRLHREVRAGGLMVGRGAPVEINEKTMVMYHEFRDAAAHLLCSFRTIIGHFDLQARKLTPWRAETLAAAEKLRIDLPAHAEPKYVPTQAKNSPVPLEETLAAGFRRSGGTGINSWECDQFGHMNTMFYIRRQTEGVPHFYEDIGLDLPAMFKSGRSFVVGEMRADYINELREGDMVEGYAAIRAVDDKSLLFELRLYNVETGEMAARTLARTVHFDSQTRRACAWSDAHRALIEENIIAD
ncbi:MAG: thioesterase family protein [Parvibaculales bacterium]